MNSTLVEYLRIYYWNPSYSALYRLKFERWRIKNMAFSVYLCLNQSGAPGQHSSLFSRHEVEMYLSIDQRFDFNTFNKINSTMGPRRLNRSLNFVYLLFKFLWCFLYQDLIYSLYFCYYFPQGVKHKEDKQRQAKELLRLHRSRCGTGSYFIDDKRMKGNVDFGAFWTQKLMADEIPVNILTGALTIFSLLPTNVSPMASNASTKKRNICLSNWINHESGQETTVRRQAMIDAINTLTNSASPLRENYLPFQVLLVTSNKFFSIWRFCMNQIPSNLIRPFSSILQWCLEISSFFSRWPTGSRLTFHH